VLLTNDGKAVIAMWHGKSAISKQTGYSHGRTAQRATRDSSIRMTNKAEAGMGAITLLGLVLFVAFFLALIGVI
jgi:hypothetical protein